MAKKQNSNENKSNVVTSSRVDARGRKVQRVLKVKRIAPRKSEVARFPWLSTHVKKLRMARDLTQEELCMKAKGRCRIGWLCNIEQGRTVPSFGSIVDICHGLGITPNQFFRWNEIEQLDNMGKYIPPDSEEYDDDEE